METMKDLQLEHLMVPVVRVVPELVFLTMAAVAVDVPVAQGDTELPSPVITPTVTVPAPAALCLWRPLVESDWNKTWSSGRTLT